LRRLATRETKNPKDQKEPKSQPFGWDDLRSKSLKLTNTPDGVVSRLIIVVRAPIVLVRVPRVLGSVTSRSTRPVIVSRIG